MNLYAESIIDELESASNNCMQDYKNLLRRSIEARSAIFKFSTERKIPIIADYVGCRNYSVLPPIKEECSEEVLQELINISGEDSGSVYKGNIQVLMVTPYSEEDLNDTYDDECVSSEQLEFLSYSLAKAATNKAETGDAQEEESCTEDYDIQYVPVTSIKLEAKQGYTDLKNFLHGSNYYCQRSRYGNSNIHQYYPGQQFYAPLQEEDDNRFFYYDNQPFTSYPKEYRCVYESPSIYAQEKYFSIKKPRYTYYLHEDYEIPQKNVLKRNKHQCRKPRRRKPTYSRQYYVQVPYSRPINITQPSGAYTTYYEKPPQYYYSPCYTMYPNEAYSGYSDYLQFQESGRFVGPYENYQYVTYPEEDIFYY